VTDAAVALSIAGQLREAKRVLYDSASEFPHRGGGGRRGEEIAAAGGDRVPTQDGAFDRRGRIGRVRTNHNRSNCLPGRAVASQGGASRSGCPRTAEWKMPGRRSRTRRRTHHDGPEVERARLDHDRGTARRASPRPSLPLQIADALRPGRAGDIDEAIVDRTGALDGAEGQEREHRPACSSPTGTSPCCTAPRGFRTDHGSTTYHAPRRAPPHMERHRATSNPLLP